VFLSRTFVTLGHHVNLVLSISNARVEHGIFLLGMSVDPRREASPKP
jgi:hypothetical protein